MSLRATRATLEALTLALPGLCSLYVENQLTAKVCRLLKGFGKFDIRSSLAVLKCKCKQIIAHVLSLIVSYILVSLR